jgi:hypothetical protein
MAAGTQGRRRDRSPSISSQEIWAAKWKEFAEADEEAKDGRGEGCAEESRGSDAKDD